MGRAVLFAAVFAMFAGAPWAAQADQSRSGEHSLSTRLGNALLPGIPRPGDDIPTIRFAESPSAYNRSQAFDRLYGMSTDPRARARPERLAPNRAAPNLFHLRF